MSGDDAQPSEDQVRPQLLPPLCRPLDHREGGEGEGDLPLLPEPGDHKERAGVGYGPLSDRGPSQVR